MKLNLIFPVITCQFFIALSMSIQAQTTGESGSLPRVTLNERFPVAAIGAFLDAMQERNMELHSIMILKNGKVVYERWFDDNKPDDNHPFYSVSKTWAAMAVGFAIAEGKFTVDDKIITFFPEDLPADISEYLAEMRIKDLLTMRVGHEDNPTKGDASRYIPGRWENYFFAYPIPYKPGTHFTYNGLASYMLSALIQKTTGEKLLDYLKPRLFEPLGIEGIQCFETAEGVHDSNAGMSGKTEDMAKLGQFLLQKGKWNDKQILPQAWIEEATTTIPYTNPGPATADTAHGPDWQQGYGYQIWKNRYGFSARGNLGQYIVVLPEQNAVIAITAHDMRFQEHLDLVWEHLLPTLKYYNSVSTNSNPISLVVPEDGGTPRNPDKIEVIGLNEFKIHASYEEGGVSILRHPVSRMNLVCSNSSDQDVKVILHIELSDSGKRTDFDNRPEAGMPERDYICPESGKKVETGER